MGRDYIPIPRIALPADLNPVGEVCALVPVPNDPEWFSMLVGLVDQLRWSALYERDPTRTHAGIVSRRWEDALATQPIILLDCDGGSAMFQLRQNPLNACQLQQSIDGGVNWSLAFDYSLCDGPLMTNPPYPDSPDGASDAAAQAMTNVYLGLLNLLDCETQSKAEYIALATNYMRTFDAGYAAPGPLGDLYDAFCALDPTEQAEALTDCPYTIMKGELTTCYDAGGLIDDLNCLSDNLINWLNEASDELMIALNTAAGLLSGSGWQAASGGAESGSGAGFGSGCGWTEEFDFSFGQLGWQPAFNAASYVAGVGWADNYPAQGTDGIRISTINTEIFRCLGVEVYLDPALGGTNPECFARNVAGNITIGEADGGGAFYGFVNNILVGGVFVGADPYVGSQQNTTAIITKIVVHGIGFNPWSE